LDRIAQTLLAADLRPRPSQNDPLPVGLETSQYYQPLLEMITTNPAADLVGFSGSIGNGRSLDVRGVNIDVLRLTFNVEQMVVRLRRVRSATAGSQ
jgi:hypothetical protein